MDYKYIEQLLERYWEANTTPQEENILRAFFSQDMLPEHLAQYQPLFVYEQTAATEQPLSDDFDRRMLERIGQSTDEAHKKEVVVKAQRITMASRLRPLFRAAAAVAIVAVLGTAAQTAFRQANQTNEAWDYNSASYADTYQHPEDALNALDAGLAEISDMLNSSTSADSLANNEDVQP